MEGIINNFRRSRTRQYPRHIILSLPAIETREQAQTFVGKDVVFTTPSGKKITGMIRSAHGNSGCVRAIFERGLPGQSIGQRVEVTA